MNELVVFGAGNMADMVRVYLERHSDYRIAAFAVDAAFKNEDSFRGYPLVAWEEIESRFPPDRVKLLGPLTPKRLNALRRDRFNEGLSRGYEFASFMHPSSLNYAEKVGRNCIVLENNVIEPLCEIGDNVIIWSGNIIGHHTTIGDHCFLSSQNGIAGCASIGPECFIGSQNGIGPGVKVGARCIVVNGAGTDRDLEDESVLIGHVGYRGELQRYKSSRVARLF